MDGINRQPKKINNVNTTKRPQIGGAAALLGLLCALANPSTLFALGSRVPDQDAFATARGNAFAATASDPSAVYYNPAGITQLDGANLSLGTYGITLGSSYTGPGGSVNSHQQWAAPPQSFATMSFTNYHLALGLGVYSPYGLSMSWPNNAPWAGLTKSGEIDYTRVNPVVAYKLLSTLSIAAGPMLDYSELQIKSPAFNLHGYDTAVGFNAAVLWQPLQQHSIGVTYRSATDMNFKGHLNTIFPPPFQAQPATLNYHFPQTAVVGYSFRPTTNWNLEADADWTDWGVLRTVPVNTLIPVPGLSSLPFHWNSSMIYEFGATRYFDQGWRASAGYMFSENSVPSGFFTPLVPDSDRHLFSIGVGKTCKHLSWDAAYQLGYGPSRSISGNANPLYNGSYEFFSHALSINIGWHF